MRILAVGDVEMLRAEIIGALPSLPMNQAPAIAFTEPGTMLRLVVDALGP